MRNMFLVLVAGLFTATVMTGPMSALLALTWAGLFLLATGADIALPLWLARKERLAMQRTITPQQLISMTGQGTPAPPQNAPTILPSGEQCKCEICQRFAAGLVPDGTDG